MTAVTKGLAVRWLLLAAVAGLIVWIVVASQRSDDDSLLFAPKPSNIDVGTPELVALKQGSRIEDCPAPQTTDGPLPSQTLACLGGGREVDLSTLQGPLVINFWSSACEPCRHEMPALQEYYEKYGDQVPIIGIDYQDTYPGVALKQAIKRGVTYPLLADPGGDLQGTDLTVQAQPQFYFLSADGELSTQAGGIDSVDDAVEMVREHLGIELS